MNKKIIRMCAVISGLSGVVILVAVLLPIASYSAESKQKYPDLISPVANTDQLFENLKVVAEKTDYTKASNWFAGGAQKDDFTSSKISYYNITIPRLEIENATVSIGGEDLSDNLIQYPGTAVPGKIGNSVIFGHSILPIFYDPENYLAIFSTLNKLKEGDDIYIDYDGISYHYEVEDKFEVKPTAVQILEQDRSSPYLSLVTCTPPGHPAKPKRLVVRAKLKPINLSDGGRH